MTESVKDPLIRISSRGEIEKKKKIGIRVICLTAALLISLLLLAVIGKKNPFPAAMYIFLGTFENKAKFFGSLQEIVVLLGIAVALAPAYKMKFWNIGAQGQILIGALMSAVVMIYGKELPTAVLLLFELIAASVGGALWSFLPAFFKAHRKTNETLFTLMMNYIAVQLVSFATENWRGNNSSMGIVNMTTRAGWLPTLFGNKTILPLILVLILVAAMTVYMFRSKQGYEIQVIGESVDTARYTGIRVEHVMIRTVMISGALCGFIGFLYVAGFDHTISSTTSGSYGFTAIIVCWLSHFQPVMMILYSTLIVFLNRGAINLKNKAYAPGLNEYSCELIVMLIIMAIMLSDFFIDYKLIVRKDLFLRKKKREENAHE